MDGFCHEYHPPKQCPSYSYVPQSDMQPYFDIATNYGFANYMFQSNQGGSYPAHLFLFTGTSAPVAPWQTEAHYNWTFVSGDSPTAYAGCPQTSSARANWVWPDGHEAHDPRKQPSQCYTHDSLVTAAANCDPTNHCDRGLVSWAYYNESVAGSEWNTPLAIPEVCYGENAALRKACLEGVGTEWYNHVRAPNRNHYSDAPIFDDLYNCNLPQVSWVIPDLLWSDHAAVIFKKPTTVYGPSWVGDIVDAVGGGMQGSQCNGPGSGKYWTQEPTAIFVVWDDWGGWYDHILPWVARREGGGKGYTDCKPEQGQWGCGYTDGFRVPMLVVSPYTAAGYVSGACGATGLPNCPNLNPPYIHDFGSILAYTEWNFGMPFIDQSDNGYADRNAPDWYNGQVPLSDFFGSSQRNFTAIQTPEPFTCFQHTSQCFPGWTPGPPDTD